MAKTYREKLLDPRWQRRRLEALEAANWSCWNCGQTEETLHVHHRTYYRGRDPWDYDDKDLRVLCKSCHDLQGDMDEVVKKYIVAADDDLRMVGYAKGVAVVTGNLAGAHIDSHCEALGFADCMRCPVQSVTEAAERADDNFITRQVAKDLSGGRWHHG